MKTLTDLMKTKGLAKIIANLKRRSLDRLKMVKHHLSESYNERRMGIVSAGIVEDPGMHEGPRYLAGYYPTDYKSLYRLFDRLTIRENTDVFLDYGSGKGRVAITAATYPFRRVIGVEISEQLVQIARENLRRVKVELKCNKVEFINADARFYALPADVTVIFFYNPFGEQIITKVIDNIKTSLLTNTRKITIVYVNPFKFEKVIGSIDWLFKRNEFKRWDSQRCAIYESLPGRL